MREKRFVFCVLAFFMGIVPILLPTTPVLAYSYSGVHWDTNSVGADIWDLPFDWMMATFNAGLSWNYAPADFSFYFTDGPNTWGLSYLPNDSRIAITTITYGYPSLHLIEVDTVFNTRYSFSIGGDGGTYDVQTVALHEWGHWLCLNDLSWPWNRSKVMYGGYTGVKRVLTQDDINGIVHIYGQE
jgi:hypothetical protein